MSPRRFGVSGEVSTTSSMTRMKAVKVSGLSVYLCLVLLLGHPGLAAASVSDPPTEMSLTKGWHVTQDVREVGEKFGWYEPDFVTPEVKDLLTRYALHPDFAADWRAIDRLVHLQLLLAPQPYFGRDLRYFNQSAWWYRLEFPTPEAEKQTTLRFEGVDYFAKVWMNGTLLGEHEGYADPFEFEVGSLLRKSRRNVLVVKVSSPWDHLYVNPIFPTYSVVRNLLKGSYEHADGLVQRDVNPVGIWRPVKLIFHGEVRETAAPAVTTTFIDERNATAKVTWTVFNAAEASDVDYVIHIHEQGSPGEVAKTSRSVHLERGTNVLEATVSITSPKLWMTWDRGAQALYDARVELNHTRKVQLSSSATFGIRTVELHRSVDETRFFLNGKPIYLRGTTYWPDLYVSNMTRARYERDIDNAIRAGVNAFRVHVHTENPEFYQLCDRRGIVVLQDNDLNWLFPKDREFVTRAVRHFGALVKSLRNHPSVIAWTAMNEVFWGLNGLEEVVKEFKQSDARELGSKLTAAALEQDPTRPVIENSGLSNDLSSGDTHEYRGSLSGGSYFDIFRSPRDQFGSAPKLVTEFGVEAPPASTSLRQAPQVATRLADVLPRVAELYDYQYRLLKYYIERYRILKYAPNAGYFQFMWIDFSPQDFQGVYDYWGNPKDEGMGGGVRAMAESNQPIGIFMEHDVEPHALYGVNDTLQNLGRCIARWRVTSSATVIAEGSKPVQLGPDSVQRIRDLTFPVKTGETYQVVLDLIASDGRVLAHNTYIDPFRPQARPAGYPERMDDELGMRIWWAGDK